MTEEELIQRIIEYKKYKEIIKKLRENYDQYANRYFRFAEEIPLPKQQLEKEYTKEVIPDIYLQIVERQVQKKNQNADNIQKIAITENYTVASKVKEMFRLLIQKRRFIFNHLFSVKEHTTQEVVTHLVAY